MILKKIAVPCDLETSASEIVIGRARENIARAVEFDFHNFELQFGSGTILAKYKRSGDAVPYALELEKDENLYTWNITETDTEKAGTGTLEFSYLLEDGTVAKSPIYSIKVLPAMIAGEYVPTPPLTAEEYLTKVAQESIPEMTDAEIDAIVE